MSEWFYINMWKQNKLKVWVVIDESGNQITDLMTRFEASEYVYKMNNRKLKIVNKLNTEYATNNDNSGGLNENNHN